MKDKWSRQLRRRSCLGSNFIACKRFACLCFRRIPSPSLAGARDKGMERRYRGSEAIWCLKYGGLPLQTERTAPTDRRRFRFRSDKAVCLGMETTFPPLFESHSSSLTPRSPRGSPLPWVSLPPFARHDSLLRKQHRFPGEHVCAVSS